MAAKRVATFYVIEASRGFDGLMMRVKRGGAGGCAFTTGGCWRLSNGHGESKPGALVGAVALGLECGRHVTPQESLADDVDHRSIDKVRLGRYRLRQLAAVLPCGGTTRSYTSLQLFLSMIPGWEWLQLLDSCDQIDRLGQSR